MIKQSRTAKELKSQLSLIDGEIQAIKTDISNKQRLLSTKSSISNSLRKQIEDLSLVKEPVVSEHAILRYFERVKGFDLDAVRKEILTDNVLSMVKVLGGSGRYPNNDFKVVMKDNTVVTITN